MGVVQQPQPQPQAAPQLPTSANILIHKKEQRFLLLESVIDFASLVFHCVGSAIYIHLGGIDAAASLYCVFPLESSAMCNKKAVLCTAFFVIRATICEQAPIVAFTTKATLASGFLVAHCARDSGGIRTHDPQLRRLLLYPAELRNHPLPHPKSQNTPPSYGVSHSLQSVASRQRMLMRCKSK